MSFRARHPTMDALGNANTGEDRPVEAANTRSNERITLIDAGALDDDQFNQLMSNIDARHPLILPALCLLLILAGYTLAT